MLNPSQIRAAARHTGVTLVLAGPGSGKTSVIVSHIQQLIDNYHESPRSILVVTFTRAAAASMKERYLTLCHSDKTEVTFSTLHGVCYALVREAGGLKHRRIADDAESSRLQRQVLSALNPGRQVSDDQLRLFSMELSALRSGLVTEDAIQPKSLSREDFLWCASRYAGLLEECGRLDFHDLCREGTRLLKENETLRQSWQRRFAFVLVDEFQDVDPRQYALIRLLAEPDNNLFLVGDDDQSIYGFRGASPGIMGRVPKDYPGAEVIRLSLNYRCSPEILSLADRLIRHNEHRFSKMPRALPKQSGRVTYQGFSSRRQEYGWLAEHILRLVREQPKASAAVLFRTNDHVSRFRKLLRQWGIILADEGEALTGADTLVATDVLAYLRLSQGKLKRSDLLQIMNRPRRFLDGSLFDRREYDPSWLYETDGDPRLVGLKQELLAIRGLPPYGVIRYLRRGMGYDDYLKDSFSAREEELFLHLAELERLSVLARGEHSIPAYLKLLAGTKPLTVSPARLSLLTLHRAKGLEYDVVFIPELNEGILPLHGTTTREDMEEERRLLYVGMTRARFELYLCWSDPGGEDKRGPSRFLKDMGLLKE